MRASLDLKKVSEVFQIDADEMYIRSQRSKGGEYWKTCLGFYEANKDKTINQLSDKQMNWLQRIEDTLKDRESDPL